MLFREVTPKILAYIMNGDLTILIFNTKGLLLGNLALQESQIHLYNTQRARINLYLYIYNFI